MADSASESDTDGAGSTSATPMSSSASNSGKPSIVISQFRLEELTNRLASLQQENKVLKIELETFKLKCKALQEENRDLRKASVTIQARAEQEEEFISNTLFKKIQALQKEKETLAVNYEKEEEFLTNELSRKLMQLQHEKAELEQHLEQEQEFQVNKLMKKIKKMENETISKQLTLEQLRREKIDLENTLEQEQEALVNRLWKRMDKLEAEKRILQEKLDQPVSAPPSPRDVSMEIDSPENMMRHIRFLKNEVERLKKSLRTTELQHTEKRAQYIEEERHMREENIRLQRKLQREMERREALCRQLSESESSLEMDDERYFNEMSAQGLRARTVSSPIPYTPSPSSSRPISPGLSYGGHTVGFTPPATLSRAAISHYNTPALHVHGSSSHAVARPSPRRSTSPDKFKRPTPPPSPNTHSGALQPQPPPPPPAQPMVQSMSSPAAMSQHASASPAAAQPPTSQP
ncbi:coiled-coil domain-containing protein 6-like [Dunckerocampus dactyliophorus]|uniref:coiled-coil domain-containing protein 6-like n=1 Tax=Dunckerocampus dactyliophorus TaxID=161453 RepID=UPI0024073809|nr:coiled-coil domain-containing protein 6-like [Dunckerocampus dactyliophorus]